MKAKLLGAALLAALALAACGGKASFTVSGTIIGLTNQGLVLQNNGADPLPVQAGATSFSFPNSISYGKEYNVTVKTHPEHMTCEPQNGTGSAGRTASINVVINCAQNTYALGGTISNLKGEGLVLINGSAGGQLALAKDATEFTMGQIPVGTAYGLSVLTQPKNPTQQCTIANGTGVMGDGDRRNVIITCVTL
ncbi:MAG: hypothetical protein K0S48_497 [Ramlibacter sp.]|jgi:hypothetical protein|nr:hypothetical protein [Ramlibacter sp.]MCE3261966.1 hypothetical protein [Pseudoduganella sp.]